MRLVVGRIGRPHGVKGEVTVEVRTDSPEERFVVGKALETDPADVGPLPITAQRWHKDRLLVRFEEVPDRTAAEQLRRSSVVDSAELPRWTADEFHDHELIGLRVGTAKRWKVGRPAHAQDMLVVSGENARGPRAVRPRAGPRRHTAAGRVAGLLELGR